MKKKLSKGIIIVFVFLFISTCLDHDKNDANTVFLTEAGPILFISDHSGTNQLYSMNEDGSNIQQLTNDSNFEIVNARWSTDGKHIALVSYADWVPYYGPAIYVCNADGSGRIRLTKAGASEPFNYDSGYDPVWSPDSKHIAFVRIMIPEALGNSEVFIIKSDGTSEQKLTSTSSEYEEVDDWSPDGRLLLITVYGKSYRLPALVTMSLDGVYQKVISDTGLSSSGGRWSKQNIIAYYSHNVSSFGGNLILADTNGHNQAILKSSPSYFIPVDWSFMGDSLLYNNSSRIYLENINTNSLVDLTPFTDPVFSYAVSWKKTCNR